MSVRGLGPAEEAIRSSACSQRLHGLGHAEEAEGATEAQDPKQPQRGREVEVCMRVDLIECHLSDG